MCSVVVYTNNLKKTSEEPEENRKIISSFPKISCIEVKKKREKIKNILTLYFFIFHIPIHSQS